MKFLTTTLLLCLLFISCTVDIEDNKRVIYKGQFIDNTQTPISNIHIGVYADSYLIGEAYSDKNGDFSFVSLETSDRNFNIEINNPNSETYNHKYNNITIRRGNKNNNNQIYAKQLTYNLQQLELAQKAYFTLILNQSLPSQTITYNIRYRTSDCNYSYIYDFIPDETCYEYINYSNTIETSKEHTFQNILETDVEFSYQINNGNWITEIIPTADTNTIYELTY